MAAGGGVWGIDIGQCALKALRCRMSSDGKSAIADNFEYIEYPQMLSQPDADARDLVRDALKQLLSRNSFAGDKVCISVAGQSGLSRFIELPPVDPKRLPELVGFEAKQQIPFALEDVIWDYQRMPDVLSPGDEDDDIPMENVVGLFAMKRDQVMRLIQPLIDADIEIDIVQLAPVAIYNAVTYDQFPLADEQPIDPAHWTVVLMMGTESSDVVITNGYRVWQRSVPIGGNHFTKQLTKELKLTFAKAEHIKRNAREAEDAREVFRAMRPTFNDLVTEVQRTIGYFESLDRDAEIVRMFVVGSPAKLPGLTAYLEKTLGRSLGRMETFARLTGPEVVNEPLFRENVLSFCVAYGLALQGLGASKLRTNLLPREILKQRLIRSKKPWFAAVAASLLLGMAFNYFFTWRAWYSVHDEYKVNNVSWMDVGRKVASLNSQVSSFATRDEEQQATLRRLNEVGDEAVGSADGRMVWLELMKAITAALPNDRETIPTLQEVKLRDRNEIYIERIESEYFSDLTTWFDESVKEKYRQQMAVRVEMADPETRSEISTEVPAITGPGWVIEISGFHFQHNEQQGEGSEYLRKYLIDTLEFGKVSLPVGSGDQLVEFEMKELGILAPVEIEGRMDVNFSIPDPDKIGELEPAAAEGDGGRIRTGFQSRAIQRPQDTAIHEVAYRFKIQFCWTQIPAEQRLEARRLKEQLSQESTSENPGDDV